MAAYIPGRVGTTGFCIARHGGAAPWEWLRDSATGMAFDQDVTSNYHEHLSQHLLNVVHGVNTTLVLWGDQQWLSTVANGDVFHLIDRSIAFLRSPERDASVSAPLKVFKMVFVSQTFDCVSGAQHDVVRRELLSAEMGALRNLLPASDSRTLILIKIAVVINDFEAVMTIVIPPPYDDSTWDVHAYLRSDDEAVLSTNALKTVVLHCGSAEPPHGEVRATVQRMQQRLSAPIPNTQAAAHLLATLNAQAKRPAPAPGHTDWGKQRADELLADLQAMEGELVSTRAAFVAANQRAQQLEVALRGGRPDAARPLLLDPVSLQREVLRVSEHILSMLNREFQVLEAKVHAMEKAVNVPSDAKLKQILKWRQEESQALLMRLQEAPQTIIAGGTVIPPGAKLDPNHPLSLALNKNEAAAGGDGGGGAGGGGGGGAGATTGDGGSVGTSARGIDPLTMLYQERLTMLENEIAKMADVDVKACIDDYFVRELERSEREMVQWITRCRGAEEQRNVFERAVKRGT